MGAISLDAALAAHDQAAADLNRAIADALASVDRLLDADRKRLEGQVALAIPGEDRDVLIHSSTQHPSELQHLVAHLLDVPQNAVTVEVRRMGGAFGGQTFKVAAEGDIVENRVFMR